MARTITTFLMFDGVAEQAMNLYVSLFDNARITDIQRYEADEAGAEGTVKRAGLTLADQELICIDSPVKHAFTFTPAMSLFVDCENETELDRLFEQLSTDGEILMPTDDYGFSSRFAWINDRFGVSWQLNLA